MVDENRKVNLIRKLEYTLNQNQKFPISKSTSKISNEKARETTPGLTH